MPQDGRINVRIKGEEIDIRVSTVPTVYGESVSLRLLTRGKIFLSLDKLGFAMQEESRIREIIIKPTRIFCMVTGPTGSGKSTSLYAFLSTINSVTKRIITIEEPVEYELKGINQIAVQVRLSGPDLSRWGCGTFCVRTRTSSWSGKSATLKLRKSRSAPR